MGIASVRLYMEEKTCCIIKINVTLQTKRTKSNETTMITTNVKKPVVCKPMVGMSPFY